MAPPCRREPVRDPALRPRAQSHLPRGNGQRGMKPAVIFTMLQTGAEANGGIESLSQVMRWLRDHRPIVLTNLVSRQTEALQAAGIEVHIAPEAASRGIKRHPLGYVASYVRYFRTLRRLMRSTGARIVHANDPLAFQLS